MHLRMKSLALVCLVLLPALAFAQQTGTIIGKVKGTDGLVIPGATVEARSNVLPGPRATTTGGAGEYRLPALPPGKYTVTFDLSGMTKVTKDVQVQLLQETTVDVTLGVAGVSENVTVSAAIVPAIERDSAAIKSGVSAETILGVPVGQEYRDLIKLIPGVQYSQDSVRGPSAGGSGQDNVYKFDGVNVTLPLFGTLSAEPAAYDIAQVTTIKGGAKAVDFERTAGFSVDSVSKSGTSSFHGQVSYQFQSDKMAAALNNGSLSRYKKNSTWTSVNAGGPILPNKIYFYGSYYRPEYQRNNQANLYGNLPEYNSTRNEGFLKATVTPISTVLVNLSWRQSHTLSTGDTFGQATAGTAGTGGESWQKIGTADGSWVINSKSFASFKYTHFENPTQARPDNVADVTPSLTLGTRLDIANLDKQGLFSVPVPVAGQDAFNSFVAPIIDRYGYVLNGVKTGGGLVGFGTEFNKQSFFRDAAQVAYNLSLGSTMRHDIHTGVQWYTDSEDLKRSSNGWGSISVPGGRLAGAGVGGVNAYYQAIFLQQGTGQVPPIHSEFKSLNIEANDTISWKNWAFNAGVLFSRDTLYGQGLREDASALSGFVSSPGTRYKMYTVPFSKMIQPRLGATWSYNGRDTVYASYSVYTPAASSLPRAASWARNTLNAQVNAYFDATGAYYGNTMTLSSSGKLFVPNLTPRTTREILFGTSKQFNQNLTGRAYFRYRKSDHFWEDTNNNARVLFAPPAGIPQTLYIPNLTDQLAQIGSGSTYVIAELDGAYTKYYEATVESEWRTKKTFVRGSFTWSHYIGNFDQDNTSTGNDAAIFMGSSNIGDGAGRQLWNFKDGTLRGDRPASLKVYGYYQLPWNASAGAFAILQSGQPWEMWSYEPYIALTTSTSETNRYAEPAGSRRTPTHYQLDLNYTQTFRIQKRYGVQLVMDVFNIFNKQTGYNYQPAVHTAGFGLPRSYFDPRRLQLALRFQF
jgi:hypothetical protein